jgi:hypothetical protein
MAQRRIDFLSLMYKKSSDPGNSPTASRRSTRASGAGREGECNRQADARFPRRGGRGLSAAEMTAAGEEQVSPLLVLAVPVVEHGPGSAQQHAFSLYIACAELAAIGVVH